MDQKINIAELQQITNKIFDHILNVLQVDSVELTEDMYWSISDNERYAVDIQPTNFGIGQLFDDMEFLQRILEDDNQAIPAMMMHLAPIFQYLSTRVNWYQLMKTTP